MNNFMNQYNAEMNRIQQAYNQEMQNLQNSLSQYRQQQFLPPMQPNQQPMVQQEQGTPINVQILATLGDIKGILMKIAPKEEEQEKPKEKQPTKKE